ncbi:MAG: hypothetical protein IKK75_08945 [Clostridia bacterium]|nr:hypothetical protein [Clostridia bacterium]
MMKRSFFARLVSLLLALILLLGLSPALAARVIEIYAAEYPVTEDGWYSTMEEVAVYLATYEHLPDNFLTKNEAEKLGWDNRKGNLGRVAPGCSIGGNRFGNYEGVLPDAKNRKWTECDINFDGGYRGAERICFSNDGLIYYTDDHYETFTQIKVNFDGVGAEEIILDPDVELDEYGEYTTINEVSAYLLRYGCLPCNYLTKAEAKELGWTAKKDNLGKVMPGCSIGGDIFQNREKMLPEAEDRIWYECDVNTVDGKRSDERLVYSSDGLIFYTPDAFETFIQLY